MKQGGLYKNIVIFISSIITVFFVVYLSVGISTFGADIIGLLMLVIIYLVIVGMVVLPGWSVFFQPNRRRMTGFYIAGIVLFFFTAIGLLDLAFDSSGFPGACGQGFTQGNCFLLDGLNTLGYLIVCPIIFLVGYAFFAMNRRLIKNRRLI